MEIYIIIPVTSNQPPHPVLNPCIAKLPMPTATHEIPYKIRNQLLVEREGLPSVGSYCANQRIYIPTNTNAKLEIVFVGSRIQEFSLTFSQYPEALVFVQLESFKIYNSP